MTSISF